jgi:hypothetical protein
MMAKITVLEASGKGDQPIAQSPVGEPGFELIDRAELFGLGDSEDGRERVSLGHLLD